MTPDKILAMTEQQLRQLAGKYLAPGPWGHEFGYADAEAANRDDERICMRCLRPESKCEWACTTAPPAQGSPADMAEELLRECLRQGKMDELEQEATTMAAKCGFKCGGARWFAYYYAMDRERCLRAKVKCCLLALEAQ